VGTMAKFVLQRLAMVPAVLWAVATLVFFMIKLIPGDPARVAAGRNATIEQVEAMQEKLGLTKPLFEQYFSFLSQTVQGDLGTSIFTFRPVLVDLMQVLPSSIELVFAAMLINLLIAIPLGIVTALVRGSVTDVVLRLLTLIGATVPVFWLGLVLQYLLGAKLKIFPISGQKPSGTQIERVTGMTTIDAFISGDFILFTQTLRYIALPAFVLSLAFIAVSARTLRSGMINVLDSDYVQLSRAKGVSKIRMVSKHALRNAILPTFTILGMQVGWMLGSTVLVESIFGRQGIGSYATTAVLQKDIFAVISVVLVMGVVVTLLNLLVDIGHKIIDPRLRVNGG
jgi:ABC-type dipeptide/oligopeptide/nickel transport system permease component